MRRGVVALAAVAMFAVGMPAAHALEIPPANTSSKTTHFTGTVRKLVVDSDVGDIRVNVGSKTTVTRKEHWVYERPTVKMSFSGGVLTVKTECPEPPLNNCYVDVATTVARNAVVQLNTTLGSIRIDGIAGSSVLAEGSDGDIRLNSISTKTLKATTSNGGIRASLATAPDTASFRTSNGQIDATVPRGAYALSLTVRNGDVNVSGVRNKRNSPHKLSARTSNGDITITGR